MNATSVLNANNANLNAIANTITVIAININEPIVYVIAFPNAFRILCVILIPPQPLVKSQTRSDIFYFA